MANVWTHGTRTVKPGREEEFVHAWKETAERVDADARLPTSAPTLLHDRDRLNVFVSFGPWPDLEAVERFRAPAALREGVDRMQGMLERFEPRTFGEVHPDG